MNDETTPSLFAPPPLKSPISKLLLIAGEGEGEGGGGGGGGGEVGRGGEP